MSKVGTVATIPPEYFGPDAEEFFEDARTVGEMLNWTAANRPVLHLALATGLEGWATHAPTTLGWRFPTGAAGWVTRLITKIAVGVETTSIRVGVRCFMGAAQTGQVRVTIGASGAVAVGTFTAADNGGEKEVSVATSSSGTGELVVTLEINHTVGATTDSYVYAVRIEDEALDVATLPDPLDS